MNTMLVEKIKTLKIEKKAMILAHHYQMEEIKAVADYVGDSLELAKIASDCEAETLILCGVYFMAETAKILSPHKKVILPNFKAGCPMAEMVTAELLKAEKQKYPNAQVVCYVNSSAEVKAESDICCTSSNAVKIVKSLKSKQVIFVPDQNLGHYTSKFVPEKEVILWKGFCPTHHRMDMKDIKSVRQHYPEAEILVHPECRPEIVDQADFVGSTSQIISYAQKSTAKVLVIGTEEGVMATLKHNSPEKEFVLLNSHFVCPNMKKTKLEDILRVLEMGGNEVLLDPNVSKRAYHAIQKMLEASK
ncbi:quinolinate synthase NadA [Fusibacter ferrireducens]|uniref:Quinolinate synthase n=1 Tax=Fusibacter ferrireducens TaxID=2785058 RepID=A0ABR9ZXE0_9FIRM|nr:quinolinate synthase NadA [Fusibacter ferrireducens]MBF4694530.1 quinolinate synthase NadA [Fusibacter ferrireducens]